jgi:uncharacterized protein (DUF1330 family)
MSKGYWVAHGDAADIEAYKKYVAANAKPFKDFGAHFLVRGGQSERVEGSSRSRHVVIEFPSYQAALDCYNSPDYQAAIKLRLPPVAQTDLVIVEGYDGVQPS